MNPCEMRTANAGRVGFARAGGVFVKGTLLSDARLDPAAGSEPQSGNA